MPLCVECRGRIHRDARRCPHCGIRQARLERMLLRFGGLASAALAILPLWQLAINSGTLFKRSVSFEVEPSSCDSERIHLSFANFERDRFLEWSEVLLMKVNGKTVQAPMGFEPGQTRYIGTAWRGETCLQTPEMDRV